MADVSKKISQLDPGGDPRNGDLFPAARSGKTVKVPFENLLDVIIDAVTSLVSGGLIWEVVTADKTAVKGHGYIADASSAPVTILLPANPAVGDSVGIGASSVDFTVTIGCNGKKILGTITDMTVASAGDGAVLVYSGAAFGWTSGSELVSAGDGSGGGGGLAWAVVTADTTAISGRGYIADATTAPVTVLLPANPAVGDSVGVGASNVTNTVTIGCNGKKILGTIANMTVSSAGDGVVLVYSGGAFGWTSGSELVSSGDGGSGSSTYTNANAVPVTVGGIVAGTTFPTPQTMQEMWDALLHPYQLPAFTAFAITGESTSQEVGDSILAAVTFTWSTSNSANVATDSIDIRDTTSALDLILGTANDGSQAVVMPGGIQKVTAASHVFTISGTNTEAGVFSRTLTFTWYWRRHYGTNVAGTLTGADIGALVSSGLATGYAGTYAYAAGGYKYLCFADAAGGQVNTVKDQSTGFSVPMVTVGDDAAYSNVDGGGFYYALVSRTNAFGVTTNYRVYRTLNLLGGAIALVVT